MLTKTMRASYRYWIFALAYFLIIVLVTPRQMVWWYRVSFLLFAIFLFWMAHFWEQGKKNIKEYPQGLLAGILILLLSIRIVPFFHWGETPLGYDTGIYLRAFEQYLVGTRQAGPLSPIVHILSALGFSVNAMLYGFLAVFNVLLGLSLYTAAKSLFRNQIIALSALLIFVLSIAQHEAYIWMFYRMMISVMLFMVTIALVSRQSWLAILTGGFAGALHPATFLVFGLAYGVYTIVMVGRWLWWRHRFINLDGNRIIKKVIVTGLGILALAILVNWHELRGYLPYIIERKLQLANFEPFLSAELTGLYLNFTAFRLSTLFYTPLALLGAWMLLKRVKIWWMTVSANGLIFLLSFFITTFILILGRVVFYQRYLIILDLFIIIFASVALAQLIEYFKDTHWGRILLAIFVVGFSGVILYYSWTREPWISPVELKELNMASHQLEPNAYGMATDAYYTPWVYGYLTERTIAPGYFINYWSLEEWEKFWYKGTDDERVELLRRYGDDPIYIFVGSRQNENKPMREFLNKYSKRISAHIWEYQPLKNLP
ncbi:hypothetical protein A3H10_03420 [Candidatus Uhrbacteria bacterium RIFCSPLOWO2_12_FULL_46_10]|uniref:Glycosyltransferase RgtA/B/C/D-like domain-containing protein n=1 Tax=Candidatus Uhrbacteria bacterium RIFCSPLOWO2_01_FULL_47_25 TaxID=1802402 RepID=A0A1F7URG4_9BACT|nr:MAG: hypothetical protein A2752_00720 [Candidatus Uhrbacteria bacterium RIFCSPHIGHO2_01_FULL_46_23]OGL69214.1 MAG: hypothetical protein A3D60_04925 [Candidatus Uhrbacteria bacterium RIFCSPHIGHO2_02_FULL_47_29]OGL80277.1 MAG: hypothetical protein A2936_02830 [Candidatus Uhrbacteria bacterium RIFCSPLOWO2_01_FULL_47_25]OGL85352.1 MAG: hypothetical protein A3I37_00735 [Candidatus Uhrbacteria bacterium RIFCSPLOWO2_02_FULL_46_19]OGL91297.1 MAG: hypothetical protein A3H10_03420 [Candidatus Uhrbacte